MTERPPSDVTVDTMAEKVAFITSTIDDLRNRLDTAESQRDTLRTALIEAQSWIELRQMVPGERNEIPLLARIREALEGTA